MFDIQNAIVEIDGFFAGKDKIFSEYKTDVKTKRAVERNLEIIGEAVSRIMKQQQDFPISNYRKMISTRNFITHSYEKISDETVLEYCNKSLTATKERGRHNFERLK